MNIDVVRAHAARKGALVLLLLSCAGGDSAPGYTYPANPSEPERVGPATPVTTVPDTTAPGTPATAELDDAELDDAELAAPGAGGTLGAGGSFAGSGGTFAGSGGFGGTLAEDGAAGSDGFGGDGAFGGAVGGSF